MCALFDKTKEQEIVNSYMNEGKSMNWLSRYYHCRSSKIKEILLNNSVLIRRHTNYKPDNAGLTKLQIEEMKHLYQEGCITLKGLAKKYNLCSETIKKILLANDVKIKHNMPHKDFNLKQDFFEIIDTEAKAYFLGFLFSDGNVFNNQIALEIQRRDEEILQRLKKELNTINVITYRKRKNTELCCLRIVSRKMVSDLKKYGIIPNKTYETKHLPPMPFEMRRHFLRGLLDGDGWITQDKKGYYHIGYVSHYHSMAEDFQTMCNTLIEIKNETKISYKKSKSSIAYCSQFHAQRLIKRLLEELYLNCSIYLTRKYNVAKTALAHF